MTNTKTQALSKPTVGDRLIRLVFWRRRLSRILFPSPAEAQFVRIMRGQALTIPLIKSRRTGFPLTILWRGWILKGELIEREVRVGKYYLDFATPGSRFLKAIEIDGSQWHMDVLKDQERDAYLRARGWDVKRIPARRVFREPRMVYLEVCKFLKS